MKLINFYCRFFSGHFRDFLPSYSDLTITESVNEATEVLGGMLNKHKCLLESGVKIQKKMKSHSAIKKLGIFQRPRLASLGDTLKNPVKGEKRSAPSMSQPPNEQGDWHVVTMKKKKKAGSKEKRAKDPVLFAQGSTDVLSGHLCYQSNSSFHRYCVTRESCEVPVWYQAIGHR